MEESAIICPLLFTTLEEMLMCLKPQVSHRLNGHIYLTTLF